MFFMVLASVPHLQRSKIISTISIQLTRQVSSLASSLNLSHLLLMIMKARLQEIGRQLNIVLVYDNFDFNEKIKHQTLSIDNLQRQLTTSLVIEDHHMLAGGLQQS